MNHRSKLIRRFLILLISSLQFRVDAQNPVANRLKCTDEKTGRVSEACALIMLDHPDRDDENVSLEDFLEPRDFKAEEAIFQITEGSGWYLIKGVFSAEDIDLARDRVRNEPRSFLSLVYEFAMHLK